MDGYDRTVFVAVVGATPGVGKSTLCVRLAAALEERGLAVDHFREEEILTRPAYRCVAAEFSSSGVVPPEVLIEATAAYVAGTTADVVIADALFPYLPSLRVWGHKPEQISGFLAELHQVIRPVLLYLDGDPLTALPRAAARDSDPNWLAWYLDKLAVAPGSGVRDLPTAAAYLRAERDLSLRLLAGWDLHVLPARPPSAQLRLSLAILEPKLDQAELDSHATSRPSSPPATD